jgi:NADH dehydrogenase
VRFVLVEARDRLMPEISRGLAEFARPSCAAAGSRSGAATTIERVSADSTELSTGELNRDAHRGVDRRASSRTRFVGRLGLRSTDRPDQGRPYCQVEGFATSWAIGDAAAVPDPARPGLS